MNRIIVRYLILVLLSVVALSVCAADRIEAAFGKKLGEIYDTRLGERIPEGYLFDPGTNRLAHYEVYVARLVPSTKQIYAVGALSKALSEKQAHETAVVLADALEQRYGKREGKRDDRAINTDVGAVGGLFAEIRQKEGRRVGIYLFKHMTDVVRVMVLYGDDNLKFKADLEKGLTKSS